MKRFLTFWGILLLILFCVKHFCLEQEKEQEPPIAQLSKEDILDNEICTLMEPHTSDTAFCIYVRDYYNTVTLMAGDDEEARIKSKQALIQLIKEHK